MSPYLQKLYDELTPTEAERIDLEEVDMMNYEHRIKKFSTTHDLKSEMGTLQAMLADFRVIVSTVARHYQ